jgi:hypothetical protein
VAKGKGKGGLEADLQNFRPIEAVLMGGLGFILGPALNSTGLPQAAYNASAKYKAFVDAMYGAADKAGFKGAKNPWSQGGGSGVMKLVGGGIAAESVYEVQKTGRMSSKILNARLPFAIGAILDPAGPQGAALGAGGGLSGSSMGYTSGGGAEWS